ALGCADGIPAALEALERELVPALRGPLHRMGLGAAAIDETLQVMREELLVARDGGARILRYSARGQLRGWLRAVAARTGLRSVAHPNRQLELDDRVAGAAAGDLELAYMKQRYGEVFRRAFQTAVDRLDTADRVLLKQRFRHRLSVEELGALYAVHAGTISRRVAAARERLVDATRAEMVRELGIQPGEVSSILRLIHSEVAISLSTIDERPPR
ncbi:MAG TPA: hypothetical protein VLX92_03080, partial [Kofleriaceae bacterium]|nr:hypothetical protein [Kofleriaceae bacterium]